MNSNAAIKYHFAARLLHWILVGGFVFMWICGYSMNNFVPDDSTIEELLVFLHISVGVTLLFAIIARVVVRLLFKPPPLSPDHFSKFDRIGANIAHTALYILPFLIIVLGWAVVNVSNDSVTWFGINMPKLFPSVETWGQLDVEELTETLHVWLAYIMLGIALVHLAGALKHKWFDKYDILPRITLRSRK